MARRYFTQEIDGDAARLTGADATHLARVLRARPGQRVTLCDGAGTDYEAEILLADAGEVALRVLSRAPTKAEPSVDAAVFIGMAKGERMDYAIQKSVELGAGAIWPFYSQNGVVRPKNEEEKTKRYRRIAEEAAKQCGRGRLPAVGPPLPFGDMLRQAGACGKALFFYEAEGASMRAALAGWPPAGGTRADAHGESDGPDRPPRPGIALITGPEGGFAPGEAAAALAAGFELVHLGPRILRCETAPAAALAVLMALTGNLE